MLRRSGKIVALWSYGEDGLQSRSANLRMQRAGEEIDAILRTRRRYGLFYRHIKRQVSISMQWYTELRRPVRRNVRRMSSRSFAQKMRSGMQTNSHLRTSVQRSMQQSLPAL